jgi:hypothetical protein
VKVRIWGPNLPRSREPATFHVHVDGCPDTKKGIYRQVPDGWVIDAVDAKDIVTDVYPPEDFDYDPDNKNEYGQYDGDVRIFPCVSFT